MSNSVLFILGLLFAAGTLYESVSGFLIIDQSLPMYQPAKDKETQLRTQVRGRIQEIDGEKMQLINYIMQGSHGHINPEDEKAVSDIVNQEMIKESITTGSLTWHMCNPKIDDFKKAVRSAQTLCNYGTIQDLIKVNRHHDEKYDWLRQKYESYDYGITQSFENLPFYPKYETALQRLNNLQRTMDMQFEPIPKARDIIQQFQAQKSRSNSLCFAQSLQMHQVVEALKKVQDCFKHRD